MAVLEMKSGKESIKTREELIEECLEIGIPVTGHEDEETLEMFLGSADDDDDFVNDDDDFDDDFDDDELEEPVDDKEILDEEFDFEEDDDLEDDDPQYN